MAHSAVSRRAVLGTAAAGALTTAFSFAEPAEASTTLQAQITSPPRLPSTSQAQMRRLSFGLTPALASDVAAAGGVLGWVNRQLSGSFADPMGDLIDSWLPYQGASATECMTACSVLADQQTVMASRPGRFVLRALSSQRQLFERTVGFWNNHFNIPAHLRGPALYSAPEFDEIIRANAWKTFADLLAAVTTSRAMYAYLNADVSTVDELNENLGRELLELHTVGVGAGYTEAMVQDSARLLTGFVPSGAKGEMLVYDPTAHAVGPVQVLGFVDSNASPDGRTVLAAYLNYLAHHPSTATRLALGLIQYFCTDTPSNAYVSAVANAYLASGTDIKTTLRALVSHSEFGTVGAKIATPQDAYLNACRLRGYVPKAPDWSPAGDATNPFVTMSRIADSSGLPTLGWMTPDGYPWDSRLWEDSGTYLATWGTNMGIALGAPSGGFTVPSFTRLIGLPSRVTFYNAVELVARYAWQQKGDAQLHQAARSVLRTSNEGVVLTASDQRYSGGMQLVFGLALNHPLMGLR